MLQYRSQHLKYQCYAKSYDSKAERKYHYTKINSVTEALLAMVSHPYLPTTNLNFQGQSPLCKAPEDCQGFKMLNADLI